MARQGSRKTRAGCLTCKARKVKCDESKPHCRRCKSTGRHCDGYRLQAPYEKFVAYARNSTSLPTENKGEQDCAQEYLPLKHVVPATLPGNRSQYEGVSMLLFNSPPSPIHLDLTSEQALYLDAYRCRLAPRYPCPEFWQRIVLRECASNDMVRDCVVALGAMSLALRREQGWRRLRQQGLESSFSVSADHSQAAQLYGRAMDGFRRRLDSDGAAIPPRTFFITTYLFALFEKTNGNLRGANILLNRATMILSSRFCTFHDLDVDPKRKLAAFVDDDGITEAEEFFLRLVAINPLKLPYSQQMKRLCHDLSRTILHMRAPNKLASRTERLAAWNMFVTRCFLWAFHLAPITAHADSTALDDITRTQKHLLGTIAAWCEVFTSQAREATPGSSQIQLAQTVLQFTSMLRICVICSLDSTETSWDGFIPEFQRMMTNMDTRMRADVTRGDSNKAVNFDRYIFPLYMIASKCRDRTVRKRALELLFRATVGEETSDVHLVALSCQALAVAEDEERDATGFVPPLGRFRWTDCARSEDRTQATFTCLSLLPGETGRYAEKEVVLPL